jgi:hypothetical protein
MVKDITLMDRGYDIYNYYKYDMKFSKKLLIVKYGDSSGPKYGSYYIRKF